MSYLGAYLFEPSLCGYAVGFKLTYALPDYLCLLRRSGELLFGLFDACFNALYFRVEADLVVFGLSYPVLGGFDVKAQLVGLRLKLVAGRLFLRNTLVQTIFFLGKTVYLPLT